MTEATAYSAVIATRNRTDALSLSLPHLASQSRPPAEIIVVDSSDDPEANASAIRVLARGTDIPIHHIESEAGSSRQRNIGLARVQTEVVLFPDDDSLLYPDCMAAIMRIYDRDMERRIGGVGAAEARTPPPDSIEMSSAYRMTHADRIRASIAPHRVRFENRFVPEPFLLTALRKQARLGSPPNDLDEENAVVVPWLTGFRMSFRTEAAARFEFDEALGRYALFEDTDLGLAIQDSQFLLGARNAQIYHHKVPAKRGNGRALGAMQVLNRAYVIAKSGEVDARIRRALWRFLRYKCLQYAASAGSSFGRARLDGARAAMRFVSPILNSPRSELRQRYLTARDAVFAGVD